MSARGERGGRTEVSAAGQVRLRAATEADVVQIYALIVELATYERAPEQVTGTVELLRRSLFGPHPCAEAMIAERDGRVAGFALFHGTFSTWECRPGIWLEDLYVRPEHRGAGIGAMLLREVARLTVERGCTRLEFTVLDWNEPALEFYERMGTTRLAEWELHRLDGEALRRAAERELPRGA